jgi:hypothetical protein
MNINKYAYLLIMSVYILTSCKSDFGRFQESVLSYASDKKIDQKEYESLITLIKSSNSDDFRNFYTSDRQIDNSKVCDYLLKYCTAKNLIVSRDDIWQPGFTSAKTVKFNIDVCLENSASMNGYVGDNSTFKTTIFKLLTDLKNIQSTDSLNLNYINTKTIPIKISASRDDINDFYKRLNPLDFKKAGGSVINTDIENMIKRLLDKSNDHSLEIFISDCVFSPGHTDAKKYLDGQYAALYNDFLSSKSNRPNLSVIILQCTSRFEGTYYDYFDTPHPKMDMERPYYIWFIGTEPQIKSLVDSKIFDLVKGGYKNKLILQTIKEPNQPDYKILMNDKTGNYRLREGAKGPISEASKSTESRTKGLFGFNVAVDFSKSLQDSGYFLDTTNFLLSDKYNLQVESITDKSDITLTGYSHKLRLKTFDLKDETLKIDVIGKVPGWVYSSTSNDDTQIETAANEKQNTFGLKYLVEGVCDAFYPKSNKNVISTINITIKK